MKLKSLLLFTLSFVMSSSHAQTISTEAPSISAGGSTLPQKAFQIEATLGHQYTSDNFFTTHQLLVPNTLFRYGLIDRLELRLNVTPLYFNVTSSYPELTSSGFSVSGLSIGAKYQIIQLENTALSIIGQYDLPTLSRGSDGIISNEINGATGLFAFGHSFNTQHSFGANLGGSFSIPNQIFTDAQGNVLEGYSLRTAINSSLIYNFAINSKWTVFGEVFTITSRSKSVFGGEELFKSDFNTSFGADAGVLFLLKDNIQLDAAIGYNFSQDQLFESIGFNIMF